jgi:hypothetical protein
MARTLRLYSPVGTSMSPAWPVPAISSAVSRGDGRHTVSTFTNSQPDAIAVQGGFTESWRYPRKTPDRHIGDAAGQCCPRGRDAPRDVAPSVGASSAVPPPSTPGIRSSVTGAATSHTTAAEPASPGTNRRPAWPHSRRCRADPRPRLSHGAGRARDESAAAVRREDESAHGEHEAEQQAHQQQQRIVDCGGGIGSDLNATVGLATGGGARRRWCGLRWARPGGGQGQRGLGGRHTGQARRRRRGLHRRLRKAAQRTCKLIRLRAAGIVTVPPSHPGTVRRLSACCLDAVGARTRPRHHNGQRNAGHDADAEDQPPTRTGTACHRASVPSVCAGPLKSPPPHQTGELSRATHDDRDSARVCPTGSRQPGTCRSPFS